jgi:hypothetical protein
VVVLVPQVPLGAKLKPVGGRAARFPVNARRVAFTAMQPFLARAPGCLRIGNSQ